MAFSHRPIQNFLWFDTAIPEKKKVRHLIWSVDNCIIFFGYHNCIIWSARNEIVFKGVSDVTILFERVANLSWGWFVRLARRNVEVSYRV